MTHALYSNSPEITVSNLPPSNYFGSSPMVTSVIGTLRMDNGVMQVWTGSSWQTFSTQSNITLSPETVKAIQWATSKMKEEQDMEKLMAKHPSVKEALERLELMKALVKEHHETT